MIRVVLNFAIAAFINAAHPTFPEAWRPYPEVIDLVVSLPVVYGIFCIQAKRLHDLSLPAVFGLLALTFTLFPAGLEIAGQVTSVPAAITANADAITQGLAWQVLIFHVLLLFIPGKRGPNRYGLNATGEDRPRARMLED